MFQPMDIGQIPTTQFNIPAPKPKGGMFGGGGKKALSVIAEAMAAYSAGMGNPGGMAVLQGMNHRRQSASDAEMQEQQYQRQRMDGRDDYMWKQEYEQAHPSAPQPTQTDRYIAEIMDPNTPAERKKLLGQVLLPPVMGVVNGVPTMIDRASMFGGGGNNADATPTVEDGFAYTPGPGGRANQSNWKPQGGPTPPASGSFLGL
jgi:hypothetical protein